MAGKHKRRKEVRLTARWRLLDMEDDLRILQGTLKALTMISVCQDEIYPEGLHVLVRFGGEALDRPADDHPKTWCRASAGHRRAGRIATAFRPVSDWDNRPSPCLSGRTDDRSVTC